MSVAGEARADRFDLVRPHRKHLSFGHSPHHCPGAALARAETEIALSSLFDRYLDLELASTTLVPLQSIALQGIEGLPVHLSDDGLLPHVA
jgi:cytochrome P450